VALAETQTTQIVVPEMFERVAKRVASRPDDGPDTSWRTVASCRDTDPELFFPIGTTGLAITQIEAAKAVCMGCAAQTQCLEFALRSNQDSGVWGGTSEEERRHLRRTYLARRRGRTV
jgi:WhiB family redox-sensing transcriptional regulator